MCKHYYPSADAEQHQNAIEQQYKSENKEVGKFDSIDSFWHVYTHLRRPSALQPGVFLHYFVDGVKPLWEDDQCKDGGRWTVRCPKHLAGKVWEDLLMTLVGEQFGCEKASPEVLGLVLANNLASLHTWRPLSSSSLNTTTFRKSRTSRPQRGQRLEEEETVAGSREAEAAGDSSRQGVGTPKDS